MINKELQSQTIAFLRFPLMIGVVLIHARMKDVIIGGETVFNQLDYPIYSWVTTLFSEILATIAVPLFFILSGYLFFYGATFDRVAYVTKLKKRTRTILLPYIIWNLVVVCLFFLAQTLLPSLMSGMNKSIVDYTLSDWIDAFWARQTHDPASGGMPINYPLWFIRDLMVVMVCSPIIYLCVKYLKTFGVALLGVVWLLGFTTHIYGLSTTSFFFFSAGALFSIHNRNMLEYLYPFRKAATIGYAILIISDLLTVHTAIHSYVHNLGIITGCVCAITMTAWGLQKDIWRLHPWMAGCSFFIFAFHGMPLEFIIKVCVRFIPIHNDWVAIAIYLGSTALVVSIAVMLYTFMQRHTPRFLAWITGGR